MPSLVFHVDPALVERAFRALLANGPTRANDPGGVAIYEQSGEPINGPALPPLYLRDLDGALTLLHPPRAAPPKVAAPRVPYRGAGVALRMVQAPRMAQGAPNPGPMVVEALGGNRPSPGLGPLVLGGPASPSMPMMRSMQVHPPRSPSLPGYFTDVQIQRVTLLRGDEVNQPVICHLLQLGLPTTSPRLGWAYGAPPPHDRGKSYAIRSVESAACADVFVLLEGSAKFFDRSALDPHLGVDSDDRHSSSFQRVEFTSTSGGPLLFRASVVPARYRSVTRPYVDRARQPDFASPTSLSEGMLGIDHLAIDLVLEPVLETAGLGEWSNPAASDAWNLDADHRGLLRWLAAYSDATQSDYVTPTKQPPPDRPGFRFSYYLGVPFRPTSWPFNAGLTLLAGTRSMMVGLDLAPSESAAAWQADWSLFHAAPDNGAWGWPAANGQPYDFCARVDASMVVGFARASLEAVTDRTFRAGFIDYHFTDLHLSWSQAGLHTELAVEIAFFGGWLRVATISFDTAFSIERGQQTTTTRYQVKVGLFPVPNAWTDDLIRSVRFLGKACSVAGGVIRCDYGRAETEVSVLGRFAVTHASATDRTLDLHGQVMTARDVNRQTYGHLAVERVVGFARNAAKTNNPRDLFFWLQLKNDGNEATTLYDLAMVPEVQRVGQNGARQALPGNFWRYRWRAGAYDPLAYYWPFRGDGLVIPPGAVVTLEVGAMFSLFRAADGQALSDPVSLRLSCTARVVIVPPRTQPFVASVLLQDALAVPRLQQAAVQPLVFDQPGRMASSAASLAFDRMRDQAQSVGPPPVRAVEVPLPVSAPPVPQAITNGIVLRDVDSIARVGRL